MITEGGNVDALLKALGSVIESRAVASAAFHLLNMAGLLPVYQG